MGVLLVMVHIMAALVLILVVLLQSGKAGDLASAFGGSGSQTAFGSRSAATLMTRATAIAAVIFMITSLGLSIRMSAGGGSSVMEDVPAATPTEQTQPVTPPPGGDTQPQTNEGEAPAEPPAGTDPKPATSDPSSGTSGQQGSGT